MDYTCRCKPGYTCVACKVKRGDYRDWMQYEPPVRKCVDCGVAVSRHSAGRCVPCANRRRAKPLRDWAAA